MRIAIVGGGGSGLTAAWLLGQEHEVTLFERDARLGGHVQTVNVDDQGEEITLEAGFEFFSRAGWPTFCRLLDALEIPTSPYRTRFAVFRTGEQASRIMLPVDAYGRFELSRLTPRRALDLAQFGLMLASAVPLMRARDTSITLEQVLARLPLDKSFRDELLFPFLLSCWCVDPEEFLGFSAYNALAYAFINLSPRSGQIPLCSVEGGLARYPRAVLAQTPDLILRLNASIEGITRSGEALLVHAQDGRVTEVDHVVLATNAPITAQLLRDVAGTEKIRDQLERMEYSRTAVAVHSDARLMPARREDWSTHNVRYNGKHAQATVWKPWRSPRVLRSWVTYDDKLPDRMHLLAHYDHAKVTPRYFEAQRALQAMNGERGVWLAGMHMHDIDSHESAVCSAVEVVKRLAADAPRLRVLAGD
jgi:predicted NAD/FAD-binding protein